MDEKILLHALKKGDREAFAAIFNKYASVIFVFSFEMLKNEGEAGDILQETFIKLWENHKSVDPDRGVRNYLISIAKNRIYDLLKRKIVERKYIINKTISLTHSTEIDDEAYMEDLRNQILGSFSKLTPHQREILTLKSDGLSNEEIAGILGISKRTVEDHLSRSYKRLRSELQHLKDIFSVVLPLIYSFL